MFIGKTKDNKEKGLGNIKNKPPINDADMTKIHNYFRTQLRKGPNP